MQFLTNALLYRVTRLFLGFILPPILATSLIALEAWIFTPEIQLSDAVYIFTIVFSFGFIIMGVVSAIYTVLMEFPIRKRLNTVTLPSTLLGLGTGGILFILGFVVAVLTTESITKEDIFLTIWLIPYCGLIGYITGWILEKVRPRKQEQ